MFAAWPITAGLEGGLTQWLAGTGLFALTLLVLLWSKRLVLRPLRARAAHTPALWDDAVVDLLDSTGLPFYLAMGVLAASTALSLPPRAATALQTGVVLISLLQAGLWGNRLVRYLLEALIDRRAAPDDASSRTGRNMLKFFGTALIWGAVALLMLENAGINVSTLVAGLGVTGVAVAFATQNILADLIASVSILLDKPFLLGDFIIAGDYLGTIEKIGVRTTHLRSLSGELIVLANSDLAKSRLRNFRSMRERRIVFHFLLRYETPLELLEQIPALVKRTVEALPQARFDRAHLMNFAESGVDFEVCYYVLTGDYNVYCDVQQRINLQLLHAFARKGIRFAYRTQIGYLAPGETQRVGLPVETSHQEDGK